MAAVVYIRVETQDLKIQINIVRVKTKVAPLKKLTIPWLKLNAVLMLSHLIVSMQNVLNLQKRSIFLWMDSTVALGSHRTL